MDKICLDSHGFAELIRSTKDQIEASVVVRKYYTCEVPKREEDPDRTIDIVITTNTVDRHGDIIDPAGVKIEHFMKNPVVLFAHDYGRPPIGRAVELFTTDKGIVARTQFMDTETDTTGFSDLIYRMMVKGFLNASSIGFVPIQYRFIEHGVEPEEGYEHYLSQGVHFKEIDLIEYSIVPVPANPEALVAAKKSGVGIEPLCDWMSDTLKNWKEHPLRMILPRKMISKALEAVAESDDKRFVNLSDPELKDRLAKAREIAVNKLVEKISDGEIVEIERKLIREMKEAAGFEIAVTELDGKVYAGIPKAVEDFKRMNTKGAISYRRAHPDGTPKAPEDTEWNGPAEVAEADVEDLWIMCAWVADKPRDEIVKGDFKLPHHRASGRHAVVWNGVRAAMAALMGSRGGVNIPDEDREGVYRHLARHYREFDKEPPEFRHVEEQTLAKGGFYMDADGAIRSANDDIEKAKQEGTEIQTLIFPKKHWSSAEEVLNWCEEYGFRHDKVDETESSWRVRQADPDEFVYLRTICLTPSGASPGTDECRIEAVIGTRIEENDAKQDAPAEDTPPAEEAPQDTPATKGRGTLRLVASGSGPEFDRLVETVSAAAKEYREGPCRLSVEYSTEDKDVEPETKEKEESETVQYHAKKKKVRKDAIIKALIETLREVGVK